MGGETGGVPVSAASAAACGRLPAPIASTRWEKSATLQSQCIEPASELTAQVARPELGQLATGWEDWDVLTSCWKPRLNPVGWRGRQTGCHLERDWTWRETKAGEGHGRAPRPRRPPPATPKSGLKLQLLVAWRGNSLASASTVPMPSFSVAYYHRWS